MNEEIEKIIPPSIPEIKNQKPRWATIEHEDGFEEKFPLNFKAMQIGLEEMQEEMKAISDINLELLGPAEKNQQD